MRHQSTTSIIGLVLIVGLSACGQSSPTSPAETRSYRVQQHDMAPPTVATQPQYPQDYDRRHRPRGSSIYLRGEPFIPETFPPPHRRRGNVTLRGAPFLPGTYDFPYPRPEAERRYQRQMDFARVKLTEVENRIRQLEDILAVTNVASMRYRLWSELEQQRAYRARLRETLRGSSHRTN